MKKNRIALAAVGLAVVLAAADQLTKLLVIQFLYPNGRQPLIPGFLSLDYLENRGAAFGIFQNRQWLIAAITAVICVFVAVALFRWQRHNAMSRAACILILGGGVGNILDRVLRGYVVDFIHFHFFPYIFNVADICVVVGVALLVLYLFLNDREEQQDKKPAEKAEEKHA